MNPPIILIVDDEQPIREVFVGLLERSGYRCIEAADGTQALERLQTVGCDLILSDILMPEMDGLQLLERIHQHDPDIPVVMVTAMHDLEAAIGALRSGAYDYLLKPFEKEQLYHSVRRALEHRRLIQENRRYQQQLEQLVAERTAQLTQALRELEHSYDYTLEALGGALDLKDAETEGHSRRVTAYTIAIARAMGLDARTVRQIARGAFLHDIGKMGIPDAILRKPAPLTPEEEQLMRRHCEIGYQVLQNIPFLREAAEIVLSHQERYDGTGYPRGLRGKEIPLGARIFAIADALDAMLSDRPYRKGLPVSVAREEIRRCAGTQFDPEIVELFLSLPETLWLELRDTPKGPFQLAFAEEPSEATPPASTS